MREASVNIADGLFRWNFPASRSAQIFNRVSGHGQPLECLLGNRVIDGTHLQANLVVGQDHLWLTSVGHIAGSMLKPATWDVKVELVSHSINVSESRVM